MNMMKEGRTPEYPELLTAICQVVFFVGVFLGGFFLVGFFVWLVFCFVLF